MKKGLTISLVTIIAIALITGAVSCGVLFSNDQMLYNALTNNSNQLASNYGKATANIADATYYDITIDNVSDNNKSNLVVYKSKGDVVARLTMEKEEGEIDYSSKDVGPVTYNRDGRRTTIQLEDIVNYAIVSMGEEIPYSEVLAKDIVDLLKPNTFNAIRFKESLSSVEPIFDIKALFMGVKYNFTFKNAIGEVMYTMQTVVDSKNNLDKLSINIDNKIVEIVFNKMDKTSVLSLD